MSLLLPIPTNAPARRGASASLSVLAAALAMVTALIAAPAMAQGGPLSLTAPPAPPSGPQSVDPDMAPAQKAVREKRYDDAIKSFDKVLASNPRNAQARFQRAWIMAQMGHDDDAIKAFAEMAQDFPELPEPHNNLALLYAKRGDMKRAEAELLLAIDARPDYAISYSNLGDVYRRLAEQGQCRAPQSRRHARRSQPAPAAGHHGRPGRGACLRACCAQDTGQRPGRTLGQRRRARRRRFHPP